MSPRISVNSEFWKTYNSGGQVYYLRRSYEYDSTPGESSAHLPPCLTIWIFVHKITPRDESIGKISIWADRDKWNDIAHLDNQADANEQLEQAARSGNWEIEPLARMLNQGFNEILRQIENFENSRSKISGEFPLQ